MITPEEIATHRFSRSISGYDTREVDLFLDELIAQMEADRKEKAELTEAVEHLLNEVERMDAVMRDAGRRFRREAEESERQQTAEKPPRRAKPGQGPVRQDEKTAEEPETGAAAETAPENGADAPSTEAQEEAAQTDGRSCGEEA